ncbi:MAG: hypothetical protein KA745_04360 [Gemmatimonadales bacterium]|nr:hypothetical protein [Gemmatimonadales bacterium]
MNFDKVAVTLYDVLGYLLPGYLILLALSLGESTFATSSFLSLSVLTTHYIPSTVAAYFAGQAAHAVASSVTESRFRKVIQASREKLSSELYARMLSELEAVYGKEALPKAEKGNLEAYLLADSYLVAAGRGADRDVLLAREGFFKQSVVAAVALLVVLASSLAVGGVAVQPSPGVRTPVAWWPTMTATLLALAVVLLFRLRFGFYHRIKMNNTFLLFLAVRVTERQAGRA